MGYEGFEAYFGWGILALFVGGLVYLMWKRRRDRASGGGGGGGGGRPPKDTGPIHRN